LPKERSEQAPKTTIHQLDHRLDYSCCADLFNVLLSGGVHMVDIPKEVVQWRALVNGPNRYPRTKPEMVLAIIWQESAGYKWAYNPEPKYRYLWDVRLDKPFRQTTISELSSSIPPSDFYAVSGDRDGEWWAQKASIGLMQLMGAAARERGFKGKSIMECYEPALNIQYGSAHLWHWGYGAGRFLTDEEALTRYNGSHEYAVDVMAKIDAVVGSNLFA
jgi:hypothetical protein